MRILLLICCCSLLLACQNQPVLLRQDGRVTVVEDSVILNDPRKITWCGDSLVAITGNSTGSPRILFFNSYTGRYVHSIDFKARYDMNALAHVLFHVDTADKNNKAAYQNYLDGTVDLAFSIESLQLLNDSTLFINHYFDYTTGSSSGAANGAEADTLYFGMSREHLVSHYNFRTHRVDTLFAWPFPKTDSPYYSEPAKGAYLDGSVFYVTRAISIDQPLPMLRIYHMDDPMRTEVAEIPIQDTCSFPFEILHQGSGVFNTGLKGQLQYANRRKIYDLNNHTLIADFSQIIKGLFKIIQFKELDNDRWLIQYTDNGALSNARKGSAYFRLALVDLRAQQVLKTLICGSIPFVVTGPHTLTTLTEDEEEYHFQHYRF